jgi:hypothetical protein
MIYIAVIDVKAGEDDSLYHEMENLKAEENVVPLLIGRIFEESDILLLLYAGYMEALDDYLINNVRVHEAAQELVIIPIYEFTLLPSFDSMIDLSVDTSQTELEEYPIQELSESEELLMIMARIDVAPRMDRTVYDSVISLSKEDAIIPLMAGHTFHSKEFDLVLFFLTKNLEAAWEYGKILRSIEGVWDTELSLIAHFEGLVPLDQFRVLVNKSTSLRNEKR